MGGGVSGDVDGARGRPVHPQLHGSEDLPQVRKTHGGGEGQGRVPLVAHALRRRHEVRPHLAAVQHPARRLLQKDRGPDPSSASAGPSADRTCGPPQTHVHGGRISERWEESVCPLLAQCLQD